MTVITPAAGPRFTIIIPTRERAATLEHALRTVTDQDFASLEIIVSDNASTDNTRAIVEANGDPRIRYLNTGKRLSMSHNWEFALGHARGEWISYIGDDDGLLPGCLAAIDAIARAHPVELIRSRPSNYLWPALAGGPGGHLALPLGGKSGLRDCRAALKAALAGDISYLDLPTLYTGGFVHRAAIDRNRDSEGRFFLSRIPDVYSSVMLSGTCEHFYHEARPWGINGASLASTGTSQFTRSNDPERQRAQRLFLREDNIPLDPSIPYNPDGSLPRSLQALLFESYQKARSLRPLFGPIDPRDQVRAISRTAGEHADEINRWLPSFAAANGIGDIPAAGLAPRIHNLRAWLRSAIMDRLIIYPDAVPPLLTVADASRIGGDALMTAPDPIVAIMRNTARRIGRAMRK